MSYYRMPDGESLYVRKIGQGQPVLVLSGLGMQSWQWLPFLYPWRKDFQFIIPDWRGFGGSKNCQIPQHLDAISSHWQDTESLIQQLDLKHFHLIGYSMGATTAMHGMQYGQLTHQLKSYVHIDQTPKISTDEQWPFGLFGEKYVNFKALLQKLSDFLHQHHMYTTVQDLPTKPRNQLVKLWLEFIQLQGSNKVSPLLFKLALKQPKLQKHILPLQRLDYLIWYIDNYLNHQEDYREAVSQLTCPAAFFIGAQSSLYPAQGQKDIASSVEHAQSIVFQRSGHTPLLTEPVKFSKEIYRFLQQNR